MSNHSTQRTAEADGNVISQVLGHKSQYWTNQFTLMGIAPKFLTIHPTVDQLFYSKQKLQLYIGTKVEGSLKPLRYIL